MAASRITSRDIAAMTSHWLGTPPNGYLGSSYGADVKSLLQTPMAAGLADGLIAKCRQDVPILLSAPPDMVNVYAYDAELDRKVIKFEIAGELLDVDGVQSWDNADSAAITLPNTSLLDEVSEPAANLLHHTEHVSLPSQGYW